MGNTGCEKRRGWDVFSVGDDLGPFEIEKDDEENVFDSDGTAIWHVHGCMFCLAILGLELLRTTDGVWEPANNVAPRRYRRSQR